MLQQTQVSTVIPYYLRFIEAFPSATKLAAAPLERVLELWSGLGYYRRARMLHQAAQATVERFNGEFPSDYESARSLPGVGDYTARAVLSIAYDQPYFVLDGNVARVASRLLALMGNIHEKHFRDAVEAFLGQTLSRRRPGEFNQAIMQLGQLICTPRAPQCDVCPLRQECSALAQGDPCRYPAARPRRAAELHYLAAAVVLRRNQVALVRGLDDGLLNDLWNFPSAFGRTSSDARGALARRFTLLLPAGRLESMPSATVTHNITHRSIRVEIYSLTSENTKPAGPRSKAQKHPGASDNHQPEIRWISFNGLRQAAISRLARKVVEAVSPLSSR